MTRSEPMQQMLLDLGLPPPPTLDGFVTGRNAELLALLHGLAAGTIANQPGVHLWGEAGCGRSHLLQALGGTTNACYVDCGLTAVPADDPAVRLWCIDDVERTGAADQLALFNLINAVRSRPGACVVTSALAPPRYLALPAEREDLRTRLGWGLVFRVHALDDADKQAALSRHANQRGMSLAPEVARYLVEHFTRDMPSLIRLVDALDRHALIRQRPLTVPLIRDFMLNGTDPVHVRPDLRETAPTT